MLGKARRRRRGAVARHDRRRRHRQCSRPPAACPTSRGRGLARGDTRRVARAPSHLEAVYFLTPSAKSVRACVTTGQTRRICRQEGGDIRGVRDVPQGARLPHLALPSRSSQPSSANPSSRPSRPSPSSTWVSDQGQRTCVTGQEYALVDFFEASRRRIRPVAQRSGRGTEICNSRVAQGCGRYKSVGPDDEARRRGGAERCTADDYLANKSGQSWPPRATCSSLIGRWIPSRQSFTSGRHGDAL